MPQRINSSSSLSNHGVHQVERHSQVCQPREKKIGLKLASRLVLRLPELPHKTLERSAGRTIPDCRPAKVRRWNQGLQRDLAERLLEHAVVVNDQVKRHRHAP